LNLYAHGDWLNGLFGFLYDHLVILFFFLFFFGLNYFDYGYGVFLLASAHVRSITLWKNVLGTKGANFGVHFGDPKK
jgi:hypothetical protein